MDNKLKRAIAIIALILVGVFSVALIAYLFDKTLLNGALVDIALWSGGFGLLLFIVLWLSHAFPSQQVKDEERDRLYKEAEEKEENDEEAADKGEAETPTETENLSGEADALDKSVVAEANEPNRSDNDK